MKSPYVGPLYLPLIYIAYKHGSGLRTLISFRFLAVFIIPVTVMFLWQRHANHVNETYFHANDYPFKYLYSAVVVKLHPFNTWYFGSLEQRLDFNNYITLWYRIAKEILGLVCFSCLSDLLPLLRKDKSFFIFGLPQPLSQ